MKNRCDLCGFHKKLIKKKEKPQHGDFSFESYRIFWITTAF